MTGTANKIPKANRLIMFIIDSPLFMMRLELEPSQRHHNPSNVLEGFRYYPEANANKGHLDFEKPYISIAFPRNNYEPPSNLDSLQLLGSIPVLRHLASIEYPTFLITKLLDQ